MTKFLKKNLRFIISFIATALIFVAVFFLRYHYSNDILLSLSDGFSIAGLLMICFGGLCYTASEGAFDGITYATKQLWYLMKRTGNKYPYTYQEYRAMKHTKEVQFSHLFINGGIFLLVGIVLVIINAK